MIRVRDAGAGQKYRYTVMIQIGEEFVFYAFPQDPQGNYRFLGDSREGFHDSAAFGEVIGPEDLPYHWFEVVKEISREEKRISQP